MKYLPLCLMVLWAVTGCSHGVSTEDLDRQFREKAEKEDKAIDTLSAQLSSVRDSFADTKDAVDGVEVRLNNMLEARKKELGEQPLVDLPPAKDPSIPKTAVVLDDSEIARIADAVAERNKSSVKAEQDGKEKVVQEQQFVVLDQSDLEKFVRRAIKDAAGEQGWIVRSRDPPVNLQRATWHCRYVVEDLSWDCWLNAQSATIYCQYHGYFRKKAVPAEKMDELREKIQNAISKWTQYATAHKDELVRDWPRGQYYYFYPQYSPYYQGYNPYYPYYQGY